MTITNAYLTRMPVGFPGVVSRPEQSTIEPGIMDQDTPVTAFGVFIKTVSGKVQPIASGDLATVVKGLLVKPFPFQEPSVNEALGAGTPDKTRPCDIMKRGYLTVLFKGTTAAKDGQVYVRVTADGSKAVGDIEEAADSAKCVAVSNCFFMGAADANGYVEIAYNL